MSDVGSPEPTKVKKKKPRSEKGQQRRLARAAAAAAAPAPPAADPEPLIRSGPPTYTVSIGIPGSVIENTQTLDHAYFVAGQLARTAAVFNVDEVVVFDDSEGADAASAAPTTSKAAAFLARILQFMETPQYLRRALVPMHADFKLAGLLPPLDAPHHMRATEWAPWREGVVTGPAPGGCLVDVGLQEAAYLPHDVPPKTRVTLRVGEEPERSTIDGSSVITATLASPSDPRTQGGLYWGYTVRVAKGVTDLIAGCPYPGGYDLKLGTSEHGRRTQPHQLKLPAFRHLLIAFGGPPGLEDCLAKDDVLWESQPSDVFDMYLNTCPNQGSRTIRTEEALLVSLSWFQTAIHRYGQ